MNAQQLVADYEITPTQLIPALSTLVDIQRPAMLWGQPGVGKSAAAVAVAKELDMQFVDVRPLLMDPVDLRGIPTIRDGKTAWAVPDFLPPTDSPDSYLICLEELTAAPPAMQAALYQLVWDRKIGEYTLPKNASVVACGNRVSDRGVAVQMPTPLARRFTHFDVGVDATEWMQWAMQNHIADEIIFFLYARPELLNQFDPASKDHTGPCPRTWEMASDLVHVKNRFSPESLRSALRGTVGEGAAVELIGFLAVYGELPMPQTVLADPMNAPTFDDRPDVLLALCGSLYRLADDTNFDAVATYAGQIRPEVGEFLMGSCIRRNPALQYTRANTGWIAKNAA